MKSHFFSFSVIISTTERLLDLGSCSQNILMYIFISFHITENLEGTTSLLMVSLTKITKIIIIKLFNCSLFHNCTFCITGVYGVAHSEDQHYLWTYHPSLSKYPESDVKTVERYVGVLTNFIKTL